MQKYKVCRDLLVELRRPRQPLLTVPADPDGDVAAADGEHPPPVLVTQRQPQHLHPGPGGHRPRQHGRQARHAGGPPGLQHCQRPPLPSGCQPWRSQEDEVGAEDVGEEGEEESDDDNEMKFCMMIMNF